MPLLSLAPSRYVLLLLDDVDHTLAARLSAAAAGAELITCTSREATGNALMTGRRYSALVAHHIEPELADLAARTGTPVLTMSRAARPTEVAASLVAQAVPVRRADGPIDLGPVPLHGPSQDRRRSRGRLVAVCGPGGTGTSIIAAALAAALGPAPAPGCPVPGSPATGNPATSNPATGSLTAGSPANRSPANRSPANRSPATGSLTAGSPATGSPATGGPDVALRERTRRLRVVLADLARHADQAFLSGVEEDRPTGLLDLLDAGRYRAITAADARRHTVATSGYRLLPGLRRPAHWAAVSPTALDTVLAGLVEIFDRVVADITGDFEGENDAGSLDVEERNHLARRTVRVADVVAVVGGPGANDLRRLALLVDVLLDLGIDPARIQPVINGIAPPAGAGERRHICGLPAPAIGVERRSEAVGRRLPPEAVARVVAGVHDLSARLPRPTPRPELVPLMPGVLGCRT